MVRCGDFEIWLELLMERKEKAVPVKSDSVTLRKQPWTVATISCVCERHLLDCRFISHWCISRNAESIPIPVNNSAIFITTKKNILGPVQQPGVIYTKSSSDL